MTQIANEIAKILMRHFLGSHYRSNSPGIQADREHDRASGQTRRPVRNKLAERIALQNNIIPLPPLEGLITRYTNQRKFGSLLVLRFDRDIIDFVSTHRSIGQD